MDDETEKKSFLKEIGLFRKKDRFELFFCYEWIFFFNFFLSAAKATTLFFPCQRIRAIAPLMFFFHHSHVCGSETPFIIVPSSFPIICFGKVKLQAFLPFLGHWREHSERTRPDRHPNTQIISQHEIQTRVFAFLRHHGKESWDCFESSLFPPQKFCLPHTKEPGINIISTRARVCLVG